MKWLASVTRACQGQKGGLLASTIYEFSYHGDANAKKLMKRILESVCVPLYNMLMRWITDGQLDDPYNEFFIETCADVAGDRMWHEKYQVRNAMVPSFITKGQAKMILGTGKSINFLREVCKDFSPWQKGRETEMFKNTEDQYNGIISLFLFRIDLFTRSTCLFILSGKNFFYLQQLRYSLTWTRMVVYRRLWMQFIRKRLLESLKF